MEEKLKFAKRIIEAVQDSPFAGLNQDRLGKKLGVTAPMISNYYNGLKMPSVETGINIAIKLKVRFEWLMTGRGPKPLNFDNEIHQNTINEIQPFYDVGVDAKIEKKYIVECVNAIDPHDTAQKALLDTLTNVVALAFNDDATLTKDYKERKPCRRDYATRGPDIDSARAQ